MNVHVRGHCFAFSPTIINEYLCCGRLINADNFSHSKNTCQEIIGNFHEEWPLKGLLVVSNLSVKYDIMYKIGVAIWAPNSHGSCNTPSLVGL